MKTVRNVEAAIQEIRAGRMIVVADSLDRENEGDVVVAAEKITARHMNFAIKEAGGLVCVAMPREWAANLDLQPMVPPEDNATPFGCDFTVSVDAARGITTGISADDRSNTVRLLASPSTRPWDLVRPGHIFPVRARSGGVLVRPGHTEAAVDLARLAGLRPVAMICEILDRRGQAAHGQAIRRLARAHKMKLVTIEELIEYRRTREQLVKMVAKAKLPTPFGKFTAYVYDCPSQNHQHIALVMGKISPDEPVLVRVHSQCLTGDVLHSIRCDCGWQLESAMRQIGERGGGVLLYLSQEGRGIGLANKIRAYALQDRGLDTVEANEHLGLPADMRDYSVGANILSDLGIRQIHLLTNNPRKIAGIERYGLKIVKRIPLEMQPHSAVRSYLRVKKDKLGHLLSKVQ